MKITNSSGKNRTAIARATLAEGKGRVRINSKPLEIYEPILVRQKIMEPVMIRFQGLTSTSKFGEADSWVRLLPSELPSLVGSWSGPATPP
jgi:ribosomal protein S9